LWYSNFHDHRFRFRFRFHFHFHFHFRTATLQETGTLAFVEPQSTSGIFFGSSDRGYLVLSSYQGIGRIGLLERRMR